MLQYLVAQWYLSDGYVILWYLDFWCQSESHDVIISGSIISKWYLRYLHALMTDSESQRVSKDISECQLILVKFVQYRHLEIWSPEWWCWILLGTFEGWFGRTRGRWAVCKYISNHKGRLSEINYPRIFMKISFLPHNIYDEKCVKTILQYHCVYWRNRAPINNAINLIKFEHLSSGSLCRMIFLMVWFDSGDTIVVNSPMQWTCNDDDQMMIGFNMLIIGVKSNKDKLKLKLFHPGILI